MRKPAAIGAAAAAALAIAVAGCSSGGFNGIYSLPLPGGASLGSHPYQVTARFANVVDLVPQSAVRVNDVAVGRVSRIYLPQGSWTADVTMVINGDVGDSGAAGPSIVFPSELKTKCEVVILKELSVDTGRQNIALIRSVVQFRP